MQRFRGGLAFKAHRLCVSLNSRLENNKEEEEGVGFRVECLGGEPFRGRYRWVEQTPAAATNRSQLLVRFRNQLLISFWNQLPFRFAYQFCLLSLLKHSELREPFSSRRCQSGISLVSKLSHKTDWRIPDWWQFCLKGCANQLCMNYNSARREQWPAASNGFSVCGSGFRE